MNNKMAIFSYLPAIESKKQTKQTRTETESWIWRTFWWLPDERGMWGNGWRGEGIEENQDGGVGRHTAQSRVPAWGSKASKPLAIKTCKGCSDRRNFSLTGETVGAAHGSLECTQIHPSSNQHQKGPIPLWVAVEVTESGARVEQMALFPLWHLPHIQRHNTAHGLPRPGEYLGLFPLLHNTRAKTKKYGPNERTDQNTRTRTKQWGETQPIRCRVRNIGNQYAHRNDWVWTQNTGRSEINKNVQGTNSEGKEIGTQINDLKQKEEINIQPEQNEETRIQKNERLRNLQENVPTLNVSTS